jgi:hypothetical protein
MPPFKSLAAALDAVAAKYPQRLAVTTCSASGNNSSSSRCSRLTYQELSHTTQVVATRLADYGYQPQDVLVSDFPNVGENLVLQLACNRLGVAYATAKNAASLANNLPVIKGAVAIDSSGFLQDANLPLDLLTGAAFQEFVDDAEIVSKGQDGLPLLAVGDLDTPHAFYNSGTPYTNRQALAHGRDAAQQLSMIGDDVVCISITLGHAFGMGSAVTAALLSGATIVLPAVGGLFGCGVPSERAAATQHALEHDGCTLLFADTHTLQALSSPTQPLALRNGVVKIGSGATFLAETREYGGVTLRTVGKAV